jgi:electron-transferring-flavoprotein dehydrogenase
VPGCLHNQGNYVISLGAVTKWLGEQAEALGVEIFPGFTAAEVLYDDAGAVRGVATGNLGMGKDGEPTAASSSAWSCTPSTPCSPKARAATWASSSSPVSSSTPAKTRRATRSASRSCGRSRPTSPARPGGAHRRLADGRADLRRRLPLPPGRQQGHAGLRHRAGLPEPLAQPVRGDAALEDAPGIRAHIEGGKRIGYGARAITAGGLLSLPKLVFPGGALVGCDAGYLNAARIKGSHAAIKTGMLCAEAPSRRRCSRPRAATN